MGVAAAALAIMAAASCAAVRGGSSGTRVCPGGTAGTPSLPGLPPCQWVQERAAGRSTGSRAPAPASSVWGGNASHTQQLRQLQATTPCAGNSDDGHDVTCTGDSVAVDNASSIIGSDQDTCCTCPPGSTGIYGDENLAFRFRPDGITTGGDGSLVWSASEPPGLAFTMTRLEEPHENYDEFDADTYYMSGNATEPSRITEVDGLLPGLRWDDGVGATYDQGARAHTPR